MRKDWRKLKCVYCHLGIIDGYDAGPLECTHCSSGIQFMLPDGTLALYPGGPFCGKANPDEWETAEPFVID